MANSSLFKNSILYTFGNLLLRAFSFFLIPLYTTYLTAEEYGIINLSSGFYTLASSLLVLSLQYALIRFYADYINDSDKIAKMYGTVIFFILIISIVFLLLGLLFSDAICKAFFDGIPFYPIVLMTYVISVVVGLYTVYQDILKGMQLARKSVILSYIFFFLLLGLNLLTVVKFNMGATGVIFSTVIVHVVMVLIMFYDLRRHGLLEFCIDRDILKELLKYSIPIIPHNLAFNVQIFATRVIINKVLSLTALGLYSLASQFGSIADVILSSVQSAFQPWFYGEMNKKNHETNIVVAKLTYSMIWLYGFFFIGLGLFSHEAVLIMSSTEYSTAWQYIPFIVFSIALKTPLYFLINFLYYDKSKTKYLFISTLIGCIFNLIFTVILVPLMGIVGSIIADIIALIVRFAFVEYIVKDLIRTVYSVRRMLSLSLLPMIFLAVGIIPSYLVYPEEISLNNITLKSITLTSYLVVALLFNRNIYNSIITKIFRK